MMRRDECYYYAANEPASASENLINDAVLAGGQENEQRVEHNGGSETPPV